MGGLLALGGAKSVEGAYEIGQKIAAQLQDSIGPIGSTAIEYGLPALVALYLGRLGYSAFRAFDNYKANKQG